MARHIDSVCKCAGVKASSCTSRAAAAKAPSAPSNAAISLPACTSAAASMTEYGERLREKQKLKCFYGVLERQFRRYFDAGLALHGEHRRSAPEHAGTPARQRRASARLRPVPRRRPPTRCAWPHPAQRQELRHPELARQDRGQDHRQESAEEHAAGEAQSADATSSRSPISWKSSAPNRRKGMVTASPAAATSIRAWARTRSCKSNSSSNSARGNAAGSCERSRA